MKFLARPKGRDDVCSVTQCALLTCKYYKQYSLNCIELGFFNSLNETQINGTTHLLDRCNGIITRRFIAYEPVKWEINAVLIAVSSSCSIAYIYTYISLISWLKLALFRYCYFEILSKILYFCGI